MTNPKTISVFDAKAKFSAVVKDISMGAVYVVTNRGAPVVVMYPYQADENLSIAERLENFVRAHRAISANRSWKSALELLEKLPRRKGALTEFLDGRE